MKHLYKVNNTDKLKQKLKSLEVELQSLLEQKAEYLSRIDEFNRLYILKVGDITQKILKLQDELMEDILSQVKKQYKEDQKKEEEIHNKIKKIRSKIRKIKKQIKLLNKKDREYKKLLSEYQALLEQLEVLEESLIYQEEYKLYHKQTSFEDDSIHQRYANIQFSFDSFAKEYEDIQSYNKANKLNKQEQQELKTIWKQASKLCHPDLVVDDLKSQATELMKSINEAYYQRDLVKLQEILEYIKKGTSFIINSESIDDSKILQIKIEQLTHKIVVIKDEIDKIKDDDTFKTIQNINNIEKYFIKLRKELEKKYKYMKETKLFSI